MKMFFSSEKLSLILIFMFLLINLTMQEDQAKKQTKQNKIDFKSKFMSFQDFIVKFNKKYENDIQKSKQKMIFQQNVRQLSTINCSPCGVTKFTDKTKDQLKKLSGTKTQFASVQKSVSEPSGLLASTASISNTTNTTTNSSTLEIPKSFDWRDYNVITSIKDQFNCGNCWAFSTVAFFQSQLVRRGQSKNNIDLSQQFLLQCDLISNGCNGGNLYSSMDLCLKYGIPFQANFPFNPRIYYPNICWVQIGVRYASSRRVTVSNLPDDKIIQYLLQRPLNIPIKSQNWRFYAPTNQSRTFKCESINNSISQLNHAVLLIGYTQNQWIIKNQWGKDWGVDGYIYVTRDRKFNCGIGLQINTLNYKLKSVLNVTDGTITNTTKNTNLDNATANNSTSQIKGIKK